MLGALAAGALPAASALGQAPCTCIPGGTRLLAFGDSITYGALASDITTTAYVPRVAAALGVPYTNYGIAGATMLGTVDRSSILQEMLSVQPPSRYIPCVMIVGTNDGGVYGSDPDALASFQAGLTQGLLYLTSAQRQPEPRTVQERLALRREKLSPLADGATIWVGNTPKQSAGFYAGLSSPAVQALYNAAIANAVTTVAAQGRSVHLVDIASAYDPDTMGGDPPSNVHPDDSGHAAIANAFLAAMHT